MPVASRLANRVIYVPAVADKKAAWRTHWKDLEATSGPCRKDWLMD